MFNAYVQRGTWYVDDAAHVSLFGDIVLMLIVVHVNWTAPSLRCTPNHTNAQGGN